MRLAIEPVLDGLTPFLIMRGVPMRVEMGVLILVNFVQVKSIGISGALVHVKA